LTQGLHFVLKNKNRLYKPSTSKDKWSSNAEIVIEPLLCSDNTDPLLTSQCFTSNAQATIIVASGNNFMVEFGNKLTLKNIIFDFVDSLSSAAITNPLTSA
jgi:hypothetical protein